MIRLFASDMDGTLLNEQHVISNENAASIKQLQQKGIEFMIATGRDYHSATHLLNAQGIQCALIALNGACIYTAYGTLIYQQAIVPEVSQELIDFLNQHEIDFVFQTQEGVYVFHMERFIQRVEAFTKQNTHDVHELTAAQMHDYIASAQPFEEYAYSTDEPILKFMVSSNNPADLMRVRQVFGKHTQLDITSSADDNLEITSHAAHKGLALQYYANHVGISMNETAGIGDSLNDYSMLQMVGYGFAMGNANQIIQSIATYHAPANTEDGVAHTIQRIIAGEFE